MEETIIIELDEIRAVRLTCKNCQGSISLRLGQSIPDERRQRVLGGCQICGVPWNEKELRAAEHATNVILWLNPEQLQGTLALEIKSR